MLIQEFVYNVEVAAPRSIYMHKDKGGRWTMGPLWDFDGAFDFDWSTMYTGHNYFGSYQELVLGTEPVNHKNGYQVNSFFIDLFKNKQFVSEYKTRWQTVKGRIMSDYWTSTQKYATYFSDAMNRDNKRWPIDKYHAAETTRMKQWLSRRVSFMSTVIADYPEGSK